MIKSCIATTMALGLFATQAVAADGKGTAAEATAMTKKAVTAITADGAAKTYEAIIAKDPRFVDRDLYVIVYDLNGKCLAHGANAKLVGKDLIENQDTDGKFYVKERVELATSKGTFWQDYKFTNPTTKKIEPKSTYCEKTGETIVCVGIYK
ncbi:cache domain-containing protein [Magnetospirillum sulfuroxidans]|uniref:Cache domain-containing protein n=1 Tax=Magnetospirillum sulfuroxidans TaxID=611300 RepID=A0ABS5IB47_9PROT|nr:cache domain-containing protein [Magnetospirillum sulfuroxidans]MBR9971610.1 cache domain-containing protein [Magnetospirillum sulfuroxidans]